MEDMFQARRPNLTSMAQVLLYYRYHSVLVVSLRPGSVVGEKRAKRQKTGSNSKNIGERSSSLGRGKGHHSFPSQTTYQLASLANFFFLFPPYNVEPGPRLTCSMVHEGHVPHMIKIPVVWPSHHQYTLNYYAFDISKEFTDVLIWWDATMHQGKSKLWLTLVQMNTSKDFEFHFLACHYIRLLLTPLITHNDSLPFSVQRLQLSQRQLYRLWWYLEYYGFNFNWRKHNLIEKKKNFKFFLLTLILKK